MWAAPRRGSIFFFTEPKNFLKNRTSTYRLPTFVSRIFFGQASRSIAPQYYSSFVMFLQTVPDVIPRPLHQQPITNAITDSSNNRNNLSRTSASISSAFSGPFDPILLS